MKLGIVVVYLVSEDNEKLLDIHLEKIKENTASPFAVYAGTNMLLQQFVDKLKKYPFIKICDCTRYKGPNEERRGAKEHSHYLEQLIKTAIGDDVTHIAIMHPDSFPIKVGWEKYLARKLSESCVLVSIFPQMSACSFFNRDFYNKYKPNLLPYTHEELSSSWINFQKANQATNLIETGMGYGYRIYLEKSVWYKLKRTNKGEYHCHFGSIFDDLVFHLGSAAEYQSRPMKGYTKFSFFHYFKKLVIKILPNKIKEKIKYSLPHTVLYPEIEKNKDAFLKSREALFNETEEFISFLRNGNN